MRQQLFATSFRTLLCAALLAALPACTNEDPQTPEQQVRKTLQAIEAAAEERSMAGVLEHINKDYRDHRGYQLADIKRIVQMHFIRNQNINIFTRIQSLEVNDGVAAVEVSAAMAAKGIDLSHQANRIRANTHHFSVVLSEQDGSWLVDSVSWRRGWQ